MIGPLEQIDCIIADTKEPADPDDRATLIGLMTNIRLWCSHNDVNFDSLIAESVDFE